MLKRGFLHEQTGPWWCLTGLPLYAEVNSLNHSALTLAHQRCTHRWSRAGQHNSMEEAQRNSFWEKGKHFPGSVLMGGRTGFKYLKQNQTGSEAELSLIPARLCSRIIYPMIYSPSLWHLKPWPCKGCKKQRAVPRSSCVKAGRGGWFPGRTQQRLPCPCLVVLFVHWEPQWWSDIKNWSRAELHSLCCLLKLIFVWVD